MRYVKTKNIQIDKYVNLTPNANFKSYIKIDLCDLFTDLLFCWSASHNLLEWLAVSIFNFISLLHKF